MKEIELFYLTYCPYCESAKKAIGELCLENSAFGEIGIRWIEESEERELAAQRGYYYVPSLFYKGRKLYEAKPFHSYRTIRERIREAFEEVLAE